MSDDSVLPSNLVADSADLVTKAIGEWPQKPLSGFAGLFGRPVFLELRAPFERRALRKSSLFEGVGVPIGEGRPVLVVPGFFASKTTADDLIAILTKAGWKVELAGVGRNAGPAYDSLTATEADLERLAAKTGKLVTIIGHSRGGQFARVMAVRHPQIVRQVITVGAPLFTKYPRFAVVSIPASLLDRLWRRGLFGPVSTDEEDAVDRDRYEPFPPDIGFVSIFSKTDGIVDWRLSVDPAATHVAVRTSHRAIWGSVEGVTAIANAMKWIKP